MIAIASLVTLLANVFAATAIPAGHDLQRSSVNAKAVYFMSNNRTGNQIYALPVNGSGLVSDGSVTSTGGVGASVKADYPGDSLASQGCIQINGNILYAVNAGSNSITMFEIDEHDPTKLTMVGQPVDSMGDFPNSIALSSKLGLACVSNTGTRSNVMCFKMTKHGLKPYDKTPRPITLTPVQKNPPVGPPNTISQVLFNYDDTALITIVKGDPTAKPANVGYVSYFPIHNGDISRDETRSSPKGTVGLFGSQALPNGRIFTTDFTFGAVMLGVDEKGVASTLYNYTIPNNGATCWVTQSSVTGTLYTTDAGHNTVGGFSPKTGHPIPSSTQNGKADPGVTLLDNGATSMNGIVASGDLLYAISPGEVYPGIAPVPPHVVVLKQVGQSGVESLQTFRPRVPANSTLDFDLNGLAVLEY